MKILESIFAPMKIWKNIFKEPFTIDKKDIFDEPREAADGYRGFHVNDWDQCVGCGTCEDICPTKAIEMYPIKTLLQTDGHKPERPSFDYGRCSFCALCVDICTSDSLNMSKEYIHISDDYNTMKFIPKSDGIHKIEYPAGYKRDEVSDLLDLERYEIDEIPKNGRIDSFIELIKGFSKEAAIKEASRCVECGVCTETCPAQMNIPEYIRSVFEEDLKEGLEYLYKTNPLSNACGRVCTHKCETACVLGNRGEPIAIRWLKRYIVDNSPDEDYEDVILDQVSEKGSGQIAIVGSGPGGLSAGYYLRTLGYDVDIYDQHALPGGVIRYGVPTYRFPESALNRDVKFIEKIGVNFIMNTTIGEDIQIEDLKEKYDAIYLSTGHWNPKKLPIKNIDHPDVFFSNGFLENARNYLRGTAQMPQISEHVVVIGGGDVSFDVARTLLRFQKEKYGTTDVKFIARKNEENLAATRVEIREGKEEGLKMYLEHSPSEIVIDEENKILGVKALLCNTIFNEKGQPKSKPKDVDPVIVPGSMVYFAIGSTTELEFFSDTEKEALDISRRNVLHVKDNRQVENFPHIFAGGDLTGGKEVITAVANGHDAAQSIDDYLKNK